MGDVNVDWARSAQRLPRLAAALNVGRESHRGWVEVMLGGGAVAAARGASEGDQRPVRRDRCLRVEVVVPGHGAQPWRNREDHDRSGIRRAERSIPMNPTAPRTYLFALIDAGGTVPPALAAVRRLIDRDHTVEVLAEDPATAGVKD